MALGKELNGLFWGIYTKNPLAFFGNKIGSRFFSKEECIYIFLHFSKSKMSQSDD
jgi:hypothetical protein